MKAKRRELRQDFRVPPTENLPYRVHTNRELGLMLSGLKPLAVFTDCRGRFPEPLQRYLRLFDRHVAVGRFVRKTWEWQAPMSPVELLTIMYALPGEQWRLNRMMELKQSGTWSREHEREEGRLLGYSDGQNDVWLDRLYPKG